MTKYQMKRACEISKNLDEWTAILRNLDQERSYGRLRDFVGRLKLDEEMSKEVYKLYNAYILRRIKQYEDELESL